LSLGACERPVEDDLRSQWDVYDGRQPRGVAAHCNLEGAVVLVGVGDSLVGDSLVGDSLVVKSLGVTGVGFPLGNHPGWV